MFDLLREGSEIAVLGMGAVFSLLVLLVLTMRAMSGLAALIEGPVVGSGTGKPLSQSRSEDAEITAAITAAIHSHRARIDGKIR